MGLLGTTPRPCANATAPSNRPTAITFRPTSSLGTNVGGELVLSYGDGPERTLQVGMTWDALDRLRIVLRRSGVTAGDATIVHRVLAYWGVEEYGRRLASDAPLPGEVLLLAFPGGPASSEPRRLLIACGLLEPGPR